MTVSCFLKVVSNSVLFSSSCYQQCLVFFKLSPTVSCCHQLRLTRVKKDKTSGSAQVKVRQQRLTNFKKDKTSSSCHQQCLVFFKLCMTMSCFLQILCDSVLFSSSCHQQSLVSFKLSLTVFCFHQVVTNSVLFSSSCV